MNKPLTTDERAELDMLRASLPAVQSSVSELGQALERLQLLKEADVLTHAGVAMSLKNLREQIERAIELMDSGRTTEARKTLMAMLVQEKNDA